MSNTAGATDGKNWVLAATGATLLGQVMNDAANVTTNWLTVTRSGTTVSSVVFGTGASGTAALTLDSSQNATVAGDLGVAGGDLTFNGASTITGGAGNMTITSGSGASRTLALRTTTSGSTATTALTLGADQSATFAGPIGLLSSATPTTTVGQMAFDNNAWATNFGAVQVHNGTANTFLVGVTATDTPTNGQVPTWNTGGGITWETPSGSGTVTTTGTMTSTALVTSNGTTVIQTPSATATMDSSGNISTPGTLTVGSGATTAGAMVLSQGTTQSTGTTNITIQAPTSVTSYIVTKPSAAATGVMLWTASGTTVTESAVAPGTSGNVLTSNGTTWTSAASAGGTGANPTGTVGLSAVNGAATTYLRSDGAPALSQAIAPTWTGVHTFTPTARSGGAVPYITITTPADTLQTASTESVGFLLTAATRTWSTGAITTQRERLFGSPTYAFAGASTITNAINSDFIAPAAGVNATLTNRWATRADRAQVTSLFDASSATSQIGPLVDSVDGVTPLNNIIQTVATGTVYTLTTTFANVDFGTTDPIVTLANAGTYSIYVDVQTSLVTATTTTQSVSYKLRRTNNTPADLTGSQFGDPLPVATVGSPLGPSTHIGPIKYTTATTTDAISVQGAISGALGAGTATVSACTITAIRAY